MTPATALITGAGSGIGLATGRRLAAIGYNLALLDLNTEEIGNVVRKLRKTAKGKILAMSGDVSNEADMSQAALQIKAEFGRLDAVVANAGVNGIWAPIDNIMPDEWDLTIRVNLRGTYLTLNKTIPLLKGSGGGSIVVVASINGVRTFTSPGATAYSATKAAQVAITKQLALELAQYNIRINAVCPGAIQTNIDKSTTMRHRAETEIPVIFPEGSVPLTAGKPGQADDVAKTIEFLLSDDAGHLTGSPIFVDGGQGLLR
jgi:NAD(P)-dependent dehydrogenase (short-subunit alcohol dehydrogenase family)